MSAKLRIDPCIWFNDQAEDAANFYVSVFSESGVDNICRYPKEGGEVHGRPAGSVMTVDFHLGDTHFTALNGGPYFTLNEAVSFQVLCNTQDEIDHFSARLTEDGGSQGQCGWIKDRFGLSWQITPAGMAELMRGPPDKVGRAFQAMMGMKKIDIAKLKSAFEGDQ
jgi:predicted 3-demethylubiquinone-9 3-methyltransferase (glyoxalase superfamily)